jgi:putative tryptophan/tyrosine transport system substrate-binding protein
MAARCACAAGQGRPDRLLAARPGTRSRPRLAALRAGLHELGWIEGRNIIIEFRWADGNYGRLPMLAADLVGLNVDVIVTHGAAGALAAKSATSTIPIVITAVGDMLGLGLIESLSRPGGNITGLSLFAAELTPNAWNWQKKRCRH